MWVLDHDIPSPIAAFSKVELTSCCIAAAAVFDTTAVLLLYKRKHTWKAATRSCPPKLLE